MKRFPDSSEYYDRDRAVREEVTWVMEGYWQKHMEFVKHVIETYYLTAPPSIVELGCGSGLLASRLPEDLRYTGIDKNPYFLDKARERCRGNMNRRFVCWDLRNWDDTADLAMCFSTMKHFCLDEWDAVLGKVLSLGKMAAVSVQILGQDLDDGTVFHHAFVTEERLRRAITAAGHEEVERKMLHEWRHQGFGTARDVAVLTRRKE